MLRGLRPELALLVEGPGRWRIRQLARACGLTPVVVAPAHRGGAALLVADDVNVLSRGTLELPAPAGVPRRRAVHAIVGVGGLRMVAAAVSLSAHPDARAAQAAALEQLLASVDAAALLAVDLNEPPSGAVARRLAEVLQDAFAVAGEGHGETYPNPDPSIRRDVVYVDRRLDVLRCLVPTAAPVGEVGPHRPVYVEVAARADRAAEDAA